MPLACETPLPAIVVAADWGVSWEKRWMARAVREGTRYSLSHPVPIGASEGFVGRVRQHLPAGGTALVGVDFPIGLPREYAKRKFPGMGFRVILERLEEEFFKPTDRPCLERPFGPQSTHAGVLGPNELAKMLEVELLRECDRSSKAHPMFYTLGPRQVGRAAADGWRKVIRPNLGEISLWPFDGALADLLARPGLVLAEIYPGLFFGRSGGRIGKGEGKETEGARRRVFRELMGRARSEGVEITLTPSADEWVEAGFASSDDFDPMLSILGMLRALQAGQPLQPADAPVVDQVEGWILGLIPDAATPIDLAE